LIFYELSTLKGRIIFYFSMAQNVLTFFWIQNFHGCRG
jgi:hypothetical protein